MPKLYPFHSDDECAFHAYLGLYIRLWAEVEHGLEFLIETVFMFGNGSSIRERKPSTLNDRLKFLRKGSTSLPLLHSEGPGLVRIVDEIEEESQFRHLIIHGNKRNFLRDEPHFAVLGKPKNRSASEGGDVELVVTAPIILEHYEVFGAMSLFLIGVIHRLHKQIEADLRSREAPPVRGSAGDF